VICVLVPGLRLRSIRNRALPAISTFWLIPMTLQKRKAFSKRMGVLTRPYPGHFGMWIELHRFLNVTPDDEMSIDILLAKDEEGKKNNPECIGSGIGRIEVMPAHKRDPIWLKRSRGSRQDRADLFMRI